MNREKYISPNYTPDNNTVNEIQELNKQKQDLSNFNLKEAQLEKVYLVSALMKNCNLSKANLKNASMYVINLSGSNLFKTNFEKANLNNANLENCNLLGANFLKTKLKNVNWGKDYKVIEYYEIAKKVIGWKGTWDFDLTKPEGMKRKLSDIALQKKWGWYPDTSIEEGIVKTYQHFKDQI